MERHNSHCFGNGVSARTYDGWHSIPGVGSSSGGMKGGVGVKERILLVDDEKKVTLAYRRHLYDQYQVFIAESGDEGLSIFQKEGPFAVAVSDYRMPGMDGIEFLSSIRQLAPETARIILTGYADLDCAIDAVNRGHVFRFLTKPCSVEVLNRAIKEGIMEYRSLQGKYPADEQEDFEDISELQKKMVELLKKMEAVYSQPVSSNRLGERLNLTPSYVRKIIKPLQDKGLLDVRRGKGGGYYLMPEE